MAALTQEVSQGQKNSALIVRKDMEDTSTCLLLDIQLIVTGLMLTSVGMETLLLVLLLLLGL